MPPTPPPTAAMEERPAEYLDSNNDVEPDNYNDGDRVGSQLSSRSTLHVLPPSPSASESSLTSEEISFDHNAPLAIPPSLTQQVQDSSSSTRSQLRRRDPNKEDDTRPPTLGLRDLLRMHKRDKLRRAQNQTQSSGSVPVYRSNQVQIHDSTSAISLGRSSGSADDVGLPPYTGLVGERESPADGPGGQVAGGSTGGCFARQVAIRGWKIVGGSSWTDGGKMGAYVVYDIDIGLRNGGNMSILRRYNDFARLRSDLLTKYPSLEGAIPPLPGKAHFSRFSTKFLEERQPRLQRFLRAVVLHPEMGKGGTESVVGRWVMGDAKAVPDEHAIG